MMKKLLIIFVLLLSGAEPAHVNQQILNGRDCSRTEALYHVALCKLPCTHRDHIICGGTLIRPQWVLTAAHCSDSIVMPDVHVFLNAHQVSGSISTISKRVPPPTADGVKNDIMLLKLARPVQQTMIREPTAEQCGDFESENMTFNVAGFGFKLYHLTHEGPRLALPKYLQCSQIPKAACPRDVYDEKDVLRNNRFCAGGQGEDTMQGDSGGGLVYKNAVYGVVSEGITDITGNTPGIYMNVCKFLDWINKTAI